MQFQKNYFKNQDEKTLDQEQKVSVYFSFYTDLQIESLFNIHDDMWYFAWTLGRIFSLWNVVSGCSSELLSMQCAPCASCSRHVGLLPAWGTIILCLDLGHRRWDQQQITCLSIDDGHGQLRQFLRSIFVQNYPSNREIAHFTCLWLNILPLSDSFDVWYLRNRKFRVSKVHVKTVVCGYLNSCRYLNRRIRH